MDQGRRGWGIGASSGIAATLQPPYYAVVFTSVRTDVDEGYDEVAERMVELAREQPGFLGIESARGGNGLGITVSYWANEEAILNWKRNVEHREAQRDGRSKWYEQYNVRIAKVEREYGFRLDDDRGVTFEVVRRLALMLPGVEEGTSYGTPCFRVRKKLIARLHEDGESLVLKVDPHDRDLLIATDPDAFYITDHYVGYPFVLVRLSRIGRGELRERVEDAWRIVASKRLIAAYESRD